jgi:hypothetical protein
MSNFKRSKDEEWWKIWDAVYYSFIHKHYDLLKNNYATSRQTIHWKNKSEKEKEELYNMKKQKKKKKWRKLNIGFGYLSFRLLIIVAVLEAFYLVSFLVS